MVFTLVVQINMVEVSLISVKKTPLISPIHLKGSNKLFYNENRQLLL